MARTRNIIMLLLMLLVAAGCKRTDMETMKAEDFLPVIQAYDDRLIKAYAAGDAGIMGELDSPRDKETIGELIAGLKSHNVRMMAKVKSISVKGLEKPERGRAVVFTEENWDYTYSDLKTGEIKDARRDIQYRMAYVLSVHDGRFEVALAAYREDYEKTKKNAVLK
ncbi:hypothetical protein [Geotalea sp. SG265]|uniref:hypothetical protein n=1 Tax=Geotalea sp. SG265 TaxID=2922867 RepID=UPI001FB03822|nr:hypothetical protein [Geotalea sp. SG265]